MGSFLIFFFLFVSAKKIPGNTIVNPGIKNGNELLA